MEWESCVCLMWAWSTFVMLYVMSLKLDYSKNNIEVVQLGKHKFWWLCHHLHEFLRKKFNIIKDITCVRIIHVCHSWWGMLDVLTTIILVITSNNINQGPKTLNFESFFFNWSHMLLCTDYFYRGGWFPLNWSDYIVYVFSSTLKL